MKYLIIGSKGQLGSEFERKLTELEKDFVAVDIDAIDISEYHHVIDLFSSVKPGLVINCAAYNDVDGAESNIESAFKVNAEGTKYLAFASYKFHSFLIHFSSDYVFDGEKTSGMYIETDKTNPINQYGRSKLAGELNLVNEIEKYLLFRLSWVYGKGTQNFIYKLKQWAKDKDKLNISTDEISVPTYTKIIVDVVLKSINQGIEGLYHLTNSGFASRFDWAKSIRKLSGLNAELTPVQQDFFKLPAKRPKISAMSNEKLSSELNVTIPHWEESLKEFFNFIKE